MGGRSPTVTLTSRNIHQFPPTPFRDGKSDQARMDTMIKTKPGTSNPDNTHFVLEGPIYGTMSIGFILNGGPFSTRQSATFTSSDGIVPWARKLVISEPSIVFSDLIDLFNLQAAQTEVHITQFGSGQTDLSGSISTAVLTTEIRNRDLSTAALLQSVTNSGHFKEGGITEGPFITYSGGGLTGLELKAIETSYQDSGSSWVQPVRDQFVTTGPNNNKVGTNYLLRMIADSLGANGNVPDDYDNDVEVALTVTIDTVSSATGSTSSQFVVTAHWFGSDNGVWLETTTNIIETRVDWIVAGQNSQVITVSQAVNGRLGRPADDQQWALAGISVAVFGSINLSYLSGGVSGYIKYTAATPESLKYQNVSIMTGYGGPMTVKTITMVAGTPNSRNAELLAESARFPMPIKLSESFTLYAEKLFLGTWGASFFGQEHKKFLAFLVSPTLPLATVPDMTPEEYAESPYNGIVSPAYSASTLSDAWDSVKAMGKQALSAVAPTLISAAIQHLNKGYKASRPTGRNRGVSSYSASSKRFATGSKMPVEPVRITEPSSVTVKSLGLEDVPLLGFPIERFRYAASTKGTIKFLMSRDSSPERKTMEPTDDTVVVGGPHRGLSVSKMKPKKPWKKGYRASSVTAWDRPPKRFQPNSVQYTVVCSPPEGSAPSAHAFAADPRHSGGAKVVLAAASNMHPDYRAARYAASSTPAKGFGALFDEDADDEEEANQVGQPQLVREDTVEEDPEGGDDEEEEQEDKKTGDPESKQALPTRAGAFNVSALPSASNFNPSKRLIVPERVRPRLASLDDKDLLAQFMTNNGYVATRVSTAGQVIYLPHDRDSRNHLGNLGKTFLDFHKTMSVQYFAGVNEAEATATLFGISVSLLPVPDREYQSTTAASNIGLFIDKAFQNLDEVVRVVQAFVASSAIVPFTFLYVSLLHAGALLVEDTSYSMALAAAINYAPVGMWEGIWGVPGAFHEEVDNLEPKRQVAVAYKLAHLMVGSLYDDSLTSLEACSFSYKTLCLAARTLVMMSYSFDPAVQFKTDNVAKIHASEVFKNYLEEQAMVFGIKDDNSPLSVQYYTTFRSYFGLLADQAEKLVPELNRVRVTEQDGKKVEVQFNIIEEAKAKFGKMKQKTNPKLAFITSLGDPGRITIISDENRIEQLKKVTGELRAVLANKVNVAASGDPVLVPKVRLAGRSGGFVSGKQVEDLLNQGTPKTPILVSQQFQNLKTLADLVKGTFSVIPVMYKKEGDATEYYRLIFGAVVAPNDVSLDPSVKAGQDKKKKKKKTEERPQPVRVKATASAFNF